MSDFNDKVVLVTGSSSGIGASTAVQFAKHGAKVVITGRNGEALNKVAEQIKTVSKHEPLMIIGDLADQTLPEKLINETISKYGQIDILVNNAGIGSGEDSLGNPKLLELFDTLFNVNVRSILLLTQLAMEHLEKTKGNIVNVSSIVALAPFYPVYGSSKAALDMITKTTAKELAPKGIRVNSVNPGPVATGFMRGHGLDAASSPSFVKGLESMIPLKYIPDGDDIANVILFLSNNRLSRNVTGSIVVSDSGMLLDLGCVRDMNR